MVLVSPLVESLFQSKEMLQKIKSSINLYVIYGSLITGFEN